MDENGILNLHHVALCCSDSLGLFYENNTHVFPNTVSTNCLIVSNATVHDEFTHDGLQSTRCCDDKLVILKYGI